VEARSPRGPEAATREAGKARGQLCLFGCEINKGEETRPTSVVVPRQQLRGPLLFRSLFMNLT
jgi:hypothetical protein